MGEACVVAGSARPGRCVVVDHGACAAPDEAAPESLAALRATSKQELAIAAAVVDVEGDAVVVRAGGPPGALPPLALGTLCELAALQRVRGALVVAGTDLVRLDGLQALSSVGGGVHLVDDPRLTDLSALVDRLAVVGESDGRVAGRHDEIVVARNPSLSTDEIERLRDAIAARGQDVDVFACGNADDDPCSDAIDAALDGLYGAPS